MHSIMRVILIISLVISCNCAYAQSYTNNWVFGDSIGLNFSTGTPQFFKTSIKTGGEACASISGESGNLLFYTNGVSVWDQTHTMMPNGDSLNIGYYTPGYGSSISQGVLIAPFPGNENLFYIIYLSRIGFSGCCLGLEYSIVNMALNGGNGDVTVKNSILLMDTLTEKLQIVKHGNGIDWWLIALTSGQEEGDLVKFVKFIIKPSGIEGPFYQNYADTYHEADGPNQQLGFMKFAQQGDKVCITKQIDLDIYDFDRCTGEFSNYINIDTVLQYDNFRVLYGVEFSADEGYFYINSYSFPSPRALYQYCLTCAMPVQDTKTLIFAADTVTRLMGLLLGPDNKIYMSTCRPTLPGTDSNLYVINSPSIGGLACDLDTNAVFLGGLSLPPFSGLPNMPNYNLGPLQGSECDTLLPIQTAIPDAINIYPNPSIGNIFISGTPNDLYTLTLYNLLGEKVFEQKNAPGNLQINLPVDNGIYEIVLRSADNIIRVEKLIISK